jgi:hypothetical protein
MAGGMGRKDDPFRETLAERVAATRARQAGLGHGTAGFHGAPPNASSAWTSTTPPTSPATAPSPGAAAGPAPRGPVEPVRPCWYEAPWGRQPALLLQWRRVGDTSRYVGLIVVAAPDETGTGWTVIRLWVDAAQLTRG